MNGAIPTLGVALFETETARETVELAQAAEQLGYTNLWFGDSQNIWRECAVLMGAVAVSTERILLGTGVTNLSTRHLSVVASMWATLAELSSGRAVMGIGTGYTSVGTLGRGSVRLADFESQVVQLRSLLAGESAIDSVSESKFHIEYLLKPTTIPFYMAASGPRSLRLAGSIADGVIMLVGTAPSLVAAAMREVEAGANAAGRELSDIDIVLWAPAAIDDDPVFARDQVRGRVVRSAVRKMAYDLEPALAREVEALRTRSARYSADYYHHQVADSEDAVVVSDALVDHFALAGTPEECSARLVEYAGLGVDHISLVPFPFDAKLRFVEEFARVASMTEPRL